MFAIFVCTLSVHTNSVRVLFAMARDGRLPFSAVFARVSRTTGTPVIPALLCGLVAIGILMANVSFPKVLELVTGVAILWANLAYLIVITGALWQRLQRSWPGGKPHEAGRRAFSLGRLGIPVNVAAVLWSLFMVINVGWPRTIVYGNENRFAAVVYTVILLVCGGVLFFFLGGKREPMETTESPIRAARSGSV